MVTEERDIFTVPGNGEHDYVRDPFTPKSSLLMCPYCSGGRETRFNYMSMLVRHCKKNHGIDDVKTIEEAMSEMVKPRGNSSITGEKWSLSGEMYIPEDEYIPDDVLTPGGRKYNMQEAFTAGIARPVDNVKKMPVDWVDHPLYPDSQFPMKKEVKEAFENPIPFDKWKEILNGFSKEKKSVILRFKTWFNGWKSKRQERHALDFLKDTSDLDEQFEAWEKNKKKGKMV